MFLSGFCLLWLISFGCLVCLACHFIFCHFSGQTGFSVKSLIYSLPMRRGLINYLYSTTVWPAVLQGGPGLSGLSDFVCFYLMSLAYLIFFWFRLVRLVCVILSGFNLFVWFVWICEVLFCLSSFVLSGILQKLSITLQWSEKEQKYSTF